MAIHDKQTIGPLLVDISQKYNDRTAIIFEDESVTYAEVYKKSYTIASNLWAMGVKKDDKVAVILPNCLEYFYMYYALFIIGAWIVPISIRYEQDEIKRVLDDSDANTVIYKKRIGVFDYDRILGAIKDDLPEMKNYICSDDGDNIQSKPLTDLSIESSNINLFDNYLHQNPVEPDDVAILGYTSGTTGTPKGVMITHKNLIETSIHTVKIMEVENDVGFSIAPMYAAQGFNAILLYMVSGITMKWISTFNPADIIKHVVKKEINIFHTQPTMWSLVLNLPYFKYVYFNNLNKVIVSGSLCSKNLAESIESSTNCRVLNIYGLIEATGVVTSTHLDDPQDVRVNTVGRPIPGVELKIVDENRKELPKGEIGELVVRGYLMKGYYKQPEKTATVIDNDGWLYTGDQACYYKDNINICIVGRIKDMIIRGGFNVYPIDIEECLLKFEDVQDIAVIGKPDEILGESIVAFVIEKPAVTLKNSQVIGFCRGKIANYKIPDEVIFVSQFPILDSGKVQKNLLQKWVVDGVPADFQIKYNEI